VEEVQEFTTKKYTQSENILTSSVILRQRRSPWAKKDSNCHY